jgi:hypothetical protein
VVFASGITTRHTLAEYLGSSINRLVGGTRLQTIDAVCRSFESREDWNMMRIRCRQFLARVKRGINTIRHLPNLLHRLREVENGFATHFALLEERLDLLNESLDLLKSRRELSDSCYDQFQKWKQETIVPNRPLVSVCVGTYNRAHLLTTRSLPSILNQSYSNFEVIVVGDHCTDSTRERVAAIGDSRIQFHNLPRRGDYPEDRRRRWLVAGTDTVNHALRLAKGDYITHLDDDDEFLPHRLANLVDYARESNGDFLWHPFWVEPEADQWVLNQATKLVCGQVTTSAIFYRRWLKNIPWDPLAHLLLEPGDWNRIRKIKAVGAVCVRYPEPLTRHYRECTQNNPLTINKAA